MHGATAGERSGTQCTSCVSRSQFSLRSRSCSRAPAVSRRTALRPSAPGARCQARRHLRSPASPPAPSWPASSTSPIRASSSAPASSPAGPTACAEDAFLRSPMLGKVAAAIQRLHGERPVDARGAEHRRRSKGASAISGASAVDPVAELSRAPQSISIAAPQIRGSSRPSSKPPATSMRSWAFPYPTSSASGAARPRFRRGGRRASSAEKQRAPTSRIATTTRPKTSWSTSTATRSGRRGAPRPPATSSCSTSAPSCGASRASHGLDVAGLRLHPERLQRRRGLPDPRGVPRLRPAALPDRRSVREGERLCPSGADNNRLVILFPQVKEIRRHCQSARLLGLVGLYGEQLSHAAHRRSSPSERMLDRLAQPRAAN